MGAQRIVRRNLIRAGKRKRDNPARMKGVPRDMVDGKHPTKGHRPESTWRDRVDRFPDVIVLPFARVVGRSNQIGPGQRSSFPLPFLSKQVTKKGYVKEGRARHRGRPFLTRQQMRHAQRMEAKHAS